MRLHTDPQYRDGRVRLPLVFLVASVCVCAYTNQAAATAQIAQEEHTLWQLWQYYQANPESHARIAALCEQIEQRNPNYRFLPVVRSFAGWHLLQQGRTAEAQRLLEQLDQTVPGDPLGRAAQRMGRTWLTRIDRERVREALQVVYRQNIQYPETLEPLKALNPDQRPPLQDRWGDPWTYEWAQFRMLRVGPGHRYRLESRNIRTTSDLREALKLEYGSGFELRPVRIMSVAGGRQTVEFERTTTPPEPVLLAPGASYRGQALAYFGARIMILADADHWMVVLKPSQ